MARSAMDLLATLRSFLLYQLFTFGYFEELVVKYGIHFDRHHYRRLYGNLERFSLFQFRSLHLAEPRYKRPYPEMVPKWTLEITSITLGLFAFLCRTLAVLFLGTATRTRQSRIIFGTEMWGRVSPYVETTFLCWSLIVWTFYQFCLPGSLLDYKFLAIFRMSLKPKLNSFPASTFGLTVGEFTRFDAFRRACTGAYYGTMASIPVIAPIAVALFQVRATLYQEHVLSSLLWLLIISVWTFYACTVLYSTMTVFLIVARYLQIKQVSLIVALKLRMGALHASPRVSPYGSALYQSLLQQFTCYSYFQEELLDVNGFWRKPLSFAFLNYCSLIAYFTYIIFFAPTSAYLKFVYSVILVVNLSLCGCIISVCAILVYRHSRLAVYTNAQVATLKRHGKLTLRQNLKIQNISCNLKLTESGFTLVNGYLLTFDTMRAIIVNISIYFMLTFHV